jgi:transcriptional regulator with XRE-family HTH domain
MFREAIEARMTQLGVSRSEVLRRLEEVGHPVSKQALSAWLSGSARPTVSHLVALLDVLHMHGHERVGVFDMVGRGL